MRAFHIDPSRRSVSGFDLPSGDELAEALKARGDCIVQEMELPASGDVILVRDAEPDEAGAPWVFNGKVIHGPAVIAGWDDTRDDFRDATTTLAELTTAVGWEAPR